MCTRRRVLRLQALDCYLCLDTYRPPHGRAAAPNSYLLGTLEDGHQTPALGGRQRAGLGEQNAVADAGGPVLVVRLDLGGPADDLRVARVLHPVLELDDDGLLHLVRDDHALAGLAVATLLRRVFGHCRAGHLGGVLRARGSNLWLLAHAAPPSLANSSGPVESPSSRSRITV